MTRLVMLRPGLNVPFRRSVRTPKGILRHRLTFEPRKPQELKGADLEAVEGDIGHALIVVTLDQKGKVRLPKADEQPEVTSADASATTAQDSDPPTRV